MPTTAHAPSNKASNPPLHNHAAKCDLLTANHFSQHTLSGAPSRSQSQPSHNQASSKAEHNRGSRADSTHISCLPMALLLVDAEGVAAGFTVVITGLGVGLATAASGAGEAAESPGPTATEFDGPASS